MLQEWHQDEMPISTQENTIQHFKLLYLEAVEALHETYAHILATSYLKHFTDEPQQPVHTKVKNARHHMDELARLIYQENNSLTPGKCYDISNHTSLLNNYTRDIQALIRSQIDILRRKPRRFTFFLGKTTSTPTSYRIYIEQQPKRTINVTQIRYSPLHTLRRLDSTT